MNASEAGFTPRRSWAAGAALLSLVVPVAAIALSQEPTTPFGDPARLTYYRQTVGVVLVALALAAGGFAGARNTSPAWVRGVSVALATLGALLSAYLLVTLIGSCGIGVIVGNCNP